MSKRLVGVCIVAALALAGLLAISEAFAQPYPICPGCHKCIFKWWAGWFCWHPDVGEIGRCYCYDQGAGCYADGGFCDWINVVE